MKTSRSIVAILALSCSGRQPPPNANDLLALEATARAACAVLDLERSRVPVPPRVWEFCSRLELVEPYPSAPAHSASTAVASGLGEAGSGGAGGSP